MKPISIDELMGLAAYEKARDQFRQEIIEYKKHRRLAVGERVSLLFEDRKTVLFQIQEMLRAEKITDLDKIKEEVDVYNGLIPGADELSATLLIEIEDQSQIRADLLKFLGIDEAVYLKIGDKHTIQATFEEGYSKEDKISAVQYVRFCFTPEARDAFIRGEEDIRVSINHPNYKVEAKISEEIRKSLVRDLTE
ncbi:MAG: DUF3501 family protein [Deltaproteobacteria bacterium]|nr:DUF3501 family protein [Deltaproteobacteria bacterium]